MFFNSKFLKGLTLVLVACASGLSSMWAQSASTPLPEVESIETRFKEFQSVSDGYVMGYVQFREGMPYGSVLADQTIHALYATNRFENVEIKVEQAEGDTVKVIIELTPQVHLNRSRI